jgi:hypothetical protein
MASRPLTTPGDLPGDLPDAPGLADLPSAAALPALAGHRLVDPRLAAALTTPLRGAAGDETVDAVTRALAAPPTGAIDLGCGRYAAKTFGPDHLWNGIQLWHPRPGGPAGQWCVGFVGFSLVPRREGIRTWRVDAYAPLTLHPSIRCPTCGASGVIRDGRWEEL